MRRIVARGGAACARGRLGEPLSPLSLSRFAMQRHIFPHAPAPEAPANMESADDARHDGDSTGPPPAPPKTLRVCTLASGSRGNATYIEAGDTRVLIDCGISARRIEQALSALGRSLDDLTAVLVTHCHGDHFGQLPSLLSRVTVPVYATRPTLRRIATKLDAAKRLHGTPKLVPIVALRAFDVGALAVTPIPTVHDAPQSVAFAVQVESRRFAVITDLGSANSALARLLPTLDAMVFEANHDLTMLQQGPYPAVLKRRVAGSQGHLSNDDCATLLHAHATSRLHTIRLAHLSGENNHPDLALGTVREALAARPDLAHVSIAIARQDEPGAPFWV